MRSPTDFWDCNCLPLMVNNSTNSPSEVPSIMIKLTAEYTFMLLLTDGKIIEVSKFFSLTKMN